MVIFHGKLLNNQMVNSWNLWLNGLKWANKNTFYFLTHFQQQKGSKTTPGEPPIEVDKKHPIELGFLALLNVWSHFL